MGMWVEAGIGGVRGWRGRTAPLDPDPLCRAFQHYTLDLDSTATLTQGKGIKLNFS